MVCGGVAGGVSATLLNPFELLRTRLQSRAVSTTSFKAIVQHEGVKALFRGVGPTLVGAVPSQGISFAAYYYARDHLLPGQGVGLHLGSSIFAGVVNNTLTNPIWMIKTRLQQHTGTEPAHLVVKNLIQQEGVRALWRGLSASYLGVVETCIRWVVYEELKAKQKDPSHSFLFGISALSKMIASTAWYPHEVVRTRLREYGNPYRGFVHCFFSILRQEGAKRLYSGLSIHLLRSVPNSAITMVLFEALRH